MYLPHPDLIRLAFEASALLRLYWRSSTTIHTKPDGSPVSEADLAAQALITGQLSQLHPAPIIAEETDTQPGITPGSAFWLVDPLDGSRSFLRGEPDFTVNIGLVEKGLPVWGLITIPTEQVAYIGGPGYGAWRVTEQGEATAIHSRQAPIASAVVSHHFKSGKTDDFLTQQGITQRTTRASAAKFCMVAEGQAALYPRFGPTMEWDTAAGHAILLGAGGTLTTPDGAAFTYGKPGYLNGPFIARSAAK